MKNEEYNQLNKELYDFKNYFMNFIKMTISCEDLSYTIIILVEVYILMKIASFFNDKFILYLILNIIILYAPFEKRCPHFLFKSRMTLKQIIEGVFGFIECIIPRYEENTNIKKQKL